MVCQYKFRKKSRPGISEIEYKRHPSDVKYPLDIFIIVICAVLCRLDTWGDLVIYTKSRKDFWEKKFGIQAISSKAAFAKMLSAVNGKEIGGAVLDILRMRFGTAGKVIAADGKSIRGTAKSGEPPQPAADSQRICDRKRRGAGAKRPFMRKPARSPFSKRCPPIWMSRGKQSPPMPCTSSGKPAARGFSAKETDRSQTVEKNAGCLRKATDVAFSGDDCRFLSENANRAMNVLHKFALAVHKNFLACHHKKVSIKAHMFSALLHLPSSSLSFAFYVTGVALLGKSIDIFLAFCADIPGSPKAVFYFCNANIEPGAWPVKQWARATAR